MVALRLVLGDQLSHTISSLDDVAKGDVVLLCEVMAEATYVKHHPKKIAFLLAAMRHFAAELRQKKITVRYVKLDDKANTGDFTGEVKRALRETDAQAVIVTEPGEYRLLELFKDWPRQLNRPVHIRQDNRFLCSRDDFREWARGKQQLRMEFFYREMRRRHQILLGADGSPVGGKWNYDKDNRQPPAKGLTSPRRIAHKPSPILEEVLALVENRFKDHFGRLRPFHYALTRAQALQELDHFIKKLLPAFGTYQDAMVANEAYLYHSLLSSYLNAGLLLPLEICREAEAAYRRKQAPLNAVEGFIRQILGWREFMRGVYWLRMPDYGQLNYLNATEPVPSFYWGAETKMFCLAEAVRHTRDHAYSHHIQRLMVTGNFALLAGLDVKQMQDWYLEVYSDAYEWVEMPNTLGMALFGDGGIVGSKPYAASGKYIHRMSNFCERCAYDPDQTIGPNACPFNALYWDFMARHEAKLKHNQRLPFVYKTWEKFGEEKRKAIIAQANMVIKAMRRAEL